MVMKREEVEEKFLKKRTILLIGKLEFKVTDKIRETIMHLNLESSEDIRLVIDSSGGDVSPTLFLVDTIKLSKAKVIGFVNGVCNSAAFTLLQACHSRVSTEHSSFLLHFVGCDFEIRFHESLREMQRKLRLSIPRLRKSQEQTENIISQRSGLTVEKVRELMMAGEKDKVRLSPKEAKNLNFIDEIVSQYDLFP